MLSILAKKTSKKSSQKSLKCYYFWRPLGYQSNNFPRGHFGGWTSRLLARKFYRQVKINWQQSFRHHILQAQNGQEWLI